MRPLPHGQTTGVEVMASRVAHVVRARNESEQAYHTARANVREMWPAPFSLGMGYVAEVSNSGSLEIRLRSADVPVFTLYEPECVRFAAWLRENYDDLEEGA